MIVVGMYYKKKAVEDFLQDKEEVLELTGYPNNKFEFIGKSSGGKIVKL